MTSRRKWMIVAVSAAVLTIGAELAVRLGGSAGGCVQVVNEGDEPLSDLVLTYAGTTLTHGTLPAGQAAKVWFSPAAKAPLRLAFTQKGNAMSGFEYPDFDPAGIRRDGNMLVLVVRPNQVDRYVETDEHLSQPKGFYDRIIELFIAIWR